MFRLSSPPGWCWYCTVDCWHAWQGSYCVYSWQYGDPWHLWDRWGKCSICQGASRRAGVINLAIASCCLILLFAIHSNHKMYFNPPLFKWHINKGTASRSEILAGALKDNDWAIILGDPHLAKFQLAIFVSTLIVCFWLFLKLQVPCVFMCAWIWQEDTSPSLSCPMVQAWFWLLQHADHACTWTFFSLTLLLPNCCC